MPGNTAKYFAQYSNAMKMLLLSLAGTDSGSEIFCPRYETLRGRGRMKSHVCSQMRRLVPLSITQCGRPLCCWWNPTERGNEDSGSLVFPSTFSSGAQPVWSRFRCSKSPLCSQSVFSSTHWTQSSVESGLNSSFLSSFPQASVTQCAPLQELYLQWT